MMKTGFIALITAVLLHTGLLAGIPGFPNSGNLERPTIFVHGINADHTTWGVYDAAATGSFSVHQASYLIPVFGYIPHDKEAPYPVVTGASSMGKQLASLYGFKNPVTSSSGPTYKTEVSGKTRWYKVKKKTYTNTGLEFFDSGDPFMRIGMNTGTPNQTYLLFKKIREVLNHYYGSTWLTDLTKTVDLVCHSQGGLVARSLVNSYRQREPGNVVNHINHIITIQTPHLGTMIAAKTTDHPMTPIIADIKTRLKSGLISDGIELDPSIGALEGFLDDANAMLKELSEKYLTAFPALDDISYPENHASSEWRPYCAPIYCPEGNSCTGTDPAEASALTTSLRNAPYPSQPVSLRKIPVTMLYGRTKWMLPLLVSNALSELEAKYRSDYRRYLSNGTKSRFDYIFATASDLLNAMSEDLWPEYSDLLVDVSSQINHGQWTNGSYPAVARPLTETSDLGVPHISFCIENGDYVFGGTTRAQDVYHALHNPPAEYFRGDVEATYTISGEFHLQDDIRVKNGGRLYIYPGSHIKAAHGFPYPGIKVEEGGKLYVLGRHDNRVIMESDEKFWGGIELMGASRSYIRYCDISNTGTGIEIDTKGADHQIIGVSISDVTCGINIYGEESATTIKNSVFKNCSSYGIRMYPETRPVYKSGPQISECTFEDIPWAVALYGYGLMGTFAKVENSTFNSITKAPLYASSSYIHDINNIYINCPVNYYGKQAGQTDAEENTHQEIPNTGKDIQIPNPFMGSGEIRYTIHNSRETAKAGLSIFNTGGQLIANLLDGIQAAGPGSVNWNGRDRSGKQVKNGIYIYRFDVNGKTQSGTFMYRK